MSDLSSLERAVLRLVGDGESHGYALVRHAAGPARSSLYRALGRLHSRGLLTVRHELPAKAPARKAYALSREGRLRLGQSGLGA